MQVKRVLYRALDSNDYEREMLFGLLSSFEIRGLLQHTEIEAGLSTMIARLDDLCA
jgi:hypothetical protein